MKDSGWGLLCGAGCGELLLSEAALEHLALISLGERWTSTAMSSMLSVFGAPSVFPTHIILQS
jgi:hypothetical protein